MPNTLYVVGVPAFDPRDLTLRARQILAGVRCVAACDLAHAQQFLANLDLRPALVAADEQGEIWRALGGGDVALLSSEELPAPSGAQLALIQAAADRGVPVVAVPGPVLPVTALVLSGMPADSFCFLGQLPEGGEERRTLLGAVASESRTLIAVESAGRLAATLADLHAALGDRPLVAFAASEPQPGWIWRGTLAGALEEGRPDLLRRRCVLVLGGARTEDAAWDEDRLRTEVVALLKNGLRSKEIGRELSASSGWSRREIYRLAVEEAQSVPNQRK